MNDPRILVSGDYWHADFQTILAAFSVPATLVPIEKTRSVVDQGFDLIVLALSRPDQVPAATIEELQRDFPATPIVGLLGSWCEGASRSGTPMPGVRRIYGHQWNAQFQKFLLQFDESGITDWHQPATVSLADDVLANVGDSSTDEQLAGQPTAIVDETTDYFIGISALSHDQFSGLSDAITGMGWQACWLDRQAAGSPVPALLTCLCVDGNSGSDSLKQRLTDLRSTHPHLPMTLVLNFPRTQDVQMAATFGIRDIVSKPYDNSALKLSLERAIHMGVESVADGKTVAVAKPHAWQAKKFVKD